MKIPEFGSEADEARWWDEHNAAVEDRFVPRCAMERLGHCDLLVGA